MRLTAQHLLEAHVADLGFTNLVKEMLVVGSVFHDRHADAAGPAGDGMLGEPRTDNREGLHRGSRWICATVIALKLDIPNFRVVEQSDWNVHSGATRITSEWNLKAQATGYRIDAGCAA